jgi:hypothetical protein
MNATSGQLYTALQKAVDSYLSWGHTFRRHAEVQLIEYLISRRRKPEAIGISKLCCSMCNAWINSINSDLYINKWKVSGCHGRFYAWGLGTSNSKAEAAVKEMVYDEVVNLIKRHVKHPGESQSPAVDFELDDVTAASSHS